MLRRLVLAIIPLSILLAIIIGLSRLCLEEHAHGYGCLDYLEPFFSPFSKFFLIFRQHQYTWYCSILGLIAAFILLVLIWSLTRGRRTTSSICIALLIAALGESSVLLEFTTATKWLTLFAFITVAGIAVKWPGRLPSDADLPPKFSAGELLLLSLFSIFLVAKRYYLINWIPTNWDTELCNFRHFYWPSFSGLLLHEAGYHPQTSGGFLWNILNWLLGHYYEPDNYYLYTRLLGTAISVSKFFTLFFFVRNLLGPSTAFFAAALVGFGPPEDWWAREPSFHHLPGLVGIFVISATLNAYRTKQLRSFLILALLMALTRFLYPSGLFLVLVPPTFFFGIVLFNWKEWSPHLSKVTILASGLFFWLSWRTIARGVVLNQWSPVSPLDIPSHSALPKSFLETLYHLVIENGSEVFEAFFLHQTHPTHWTVALTIAPARAVTSVVIVLVLMAAARIIACRRDAIDWLFISAAFWSLFPSFMTEVTDRRMGVIFIVWILIASREFKFVTELIASDGGALLAKTLSWSVPPILTLYLGGLGSAAYNTRGQSLPYQVLRGKMIQQQVEDDTLLVYLPSSGECDSFNSVYQQLISHQCRVGWLGSAGGSPEEIERLIEAPRINRESWQYQRSGLSSCASQQSDKPWRLIKYLEFKLEQPSQILAQLRLRHPEGKYTEYQQTNINGDLYTLAVFVVERKP